MNGEVQLGSHHGPYTRDRIRRDREGQGRRLSSDGKSIEAYHDELYLRLMRGLKVSDLPAHVLHLPLKDGVRFRSSLYFLGRGHLQYLYCSQVHLLGQG
jgi:hypothetical protein